MEEASVKFYKNVGIGKRQAVHWVAIGDILILFAEKEKEALMVFYEVVELDPMRGN